MIDPKSTAGIIFREHDNYAQAIRFARKMASRLAALRYMSAADYINAAEQLEQEMRKAALEEAHGIGDTE